VRDMHLCLAAEETAEGVGLPSCHGHPVVTNRPRRARELLRAHPGAADGLFAAVLALAALISVKAVYDEMSDMDPLFQVPRAVPIVLSMLALTAPLAWRRRYPLGVAIAVVTAFLVARIVVRVPEESVTLLATFVAFYSAAVHGRRPLGSYVLLACELAVVLQVARELFLVGYMAGMHPLSQSFELAFNTVIFVSPWVLGAAVRSSRGREAQLAERARELMRERERNAEQAVFAERVRIARELHDVVAHHVSVMGIQAGAARRVMARQPKEAAAALSSIEGSSRTAVVEMQRLLGFLRSEGDSEGFGSQPGLDQVGDLVAESQRSDLDITLIIQGEPRLLSPTLEVSAYRIVQEALTNSRKHSTGRSASVRIQYRSGALDLEVIDDGASTPSDPGPDGHGLIGMRERAALHGGHVDAGPLVGGGFGVHATFPLAANLT
jgi:signal transduction histidine kinase